MRLRTPPEWHPNGRSFVYLHPTETTVLRVDDARTAPGGAQFLQTFYPLHVGAVGGIVVKWLYVILGLAPAVLSITGPIIWYKRWRQTASTMPNRDEVGTRPVDLPSPRASGDGVPRSEAASGESKAG